MTPVRLIAFPGAPNLPIFAALEQGYFEQAGVDLQMETTPSSAFQIEHLINGTFDIGAEPELRMNCVRMSTHIGESSPRLECG